MERFDVTWTIIDATGQELRRTAGPFHHRPTAERFAAGLSESIGPRLGNVQIVTTTTDDDTRKEG
ncbi:MAG: hypothetical protein ABFD77_00080 [Thermotogota bacterium]|jgi:hypothetical protein